MPAAARTSLGHNTPISKVMTAFHDHMLQAGFSDNTIRAFLSDLRLLARFQGPNKPVGSIGSTDLRNFLSWMRQERGVPCSPKTYGRRLTTIKVLFAWLAETGAIRADPAAAISHAPVSTPLPRFLYDDQVDQLLQAILLWKNEPDGDPRPHLLVTLLLATGIKKNECMAVTLADIDRSDPRQPVLFIRHTHPRQRHKERALALPPAIGPAIDQYVERYHPIDALFPCTPRNLEYVLAEAAQRAGLPDGVSFEMLRWTCAVRDYRQGMQADTLRRKLGLSKITWKDAAEKLNRLAEPIG